MDKSLHSPQNFRLSMNMPFTPPHSKQPEGKNHRSGSRRDPTGPGQVGQEMSSSEMWWTKDTGTYSEMFAMGSKIKTFTFEDDALNPLWNKASYK